MLTDLFARGDRAVEWFIDEIARLGFFGTVMLGVLCFGFYGVLDFVIYLGNH